MTRVFWDTNIMLDLLGERDPYYDDAALIATLADKKEIQLFVSALSYATVGYFLTKFSNIEITKEKLRKFRIISEIISLDDQVIEKGLNSDIRDFEDAIQYYCALNAECDIIVTRNVKDFKKSAIPVISPHEFLKSRE
jgi:predicted nucleic acid-binding protein